MKKTLAFPLIAVLTLMTACNNSDEPSATGEAANDSSGDLAPMSVGMVTWIGYSGLWVADEQGFFEEEGLEVEFNTIEDSTQIRNTLASGQLDGIATTMDSAARYADDIPMQVVLGLDKSTGADGIIVSNDIQSVDDLAGRDVAVEFGNVSEWFLAQVLQDHDMSLDDINPVEMTSSDAGAAFASGNIDAAVTWEPWLSQADASDDGQLLTSTADYPSIIVDVFGFHDDYIAEHPESISAFITAYDKGIEFINTNPDEAHDIIGSKTNLSAEEAAEQLQDITLMSASDSVEFFENDATDVIESAADFWYEQGETSERLDVTNKIDPEFVQQLTE
ncbi:ABC transporter substrate-binding protein [Geomicrobium sediminis]|uniref:NitT/TauT family transport system substrate-binding protein n=1 Tax=Geomicrobium sediminis TaxID=1347788 RepID=A0ABS2PBL2_9BACL|nr:ABC transporter substrate-binding protein [Geomicrobium sediminis]MBM7632810.1 NitT/TauT family transport system substrate-binding protein [Geomicrobium sediminis]